MNDNYQIYETDYEEYLLNNGLRSLDNEIEQAVKNKKVNYFVVKKIINYILISPWILIIII